MSDFRNNVYTSSAYYRISDFPISLCKEIFDHEREIGKGSIKTYVQKEWMTYIRY